MCLYKKVVFNWCFIKQCHLHRVYARFESQIKYMVRILVHITSHGLVLYKIVESVHISGGLFPLFLCSSVVTITINYIRCEVFCYPDI